MAILGIKLLLQAYYENGSPVPPEKLLALSNETESDGYRVQCNPGRWSASNILFFQFIESDYHKEIEPSEKFFAEIMQQLLSLEKWLKERKKILCELQSERLLLNILISLWIDQDQMELALPAEFLSACAEAKLKINLITNDFGLILGERSVATKEFLE